MPELRSAEPAPLTRGNRGWGLMLVYGLLSVILGIVAIFWPFPASLAAALVFGAFLVAAGIGAIASAVAGHAHESRLYSLIFGGISLVVGVLIWFAPVAGVVSLTMLVMGWLTARGILELYLGARFRRNRALMLFLGVLNLALVALILLTGPYSALTLPGYIIGLSFLVSGITVTANAISHRQAI
ncbi:HdeD family acid-resistance protein [Stakelama saccharophila]|uniref:DUF308 domain-containing protein n=1 Tax=Stakelama saccharophila TaxID=3075605 RepID=A0ABZ0B501_9SPHN|nr:DUF308 domain-containing protein [Stakelama sp. W311]WNO52462.1 DUF308 domain-containing protein [Stakelama sp. W311]